MAIAPRSTPSAAGFDYSVAAASNDQACCGCAASW